MKQTLLSTALCVAATSLASAQFWNLGSGVTAYSASFDGSVVAGYTTTQYFHWNATSGLVTVGGNPPGNGVGGKADISHDGSKFVGSFTNSATTFSEAAIYTIATATWQNLGANGPNSGTETSAGWALSGDGMVAAGNSWISAGSANAFQWTQAGGFLNLGTTVAGRSTRVDGANTDGSVLVGYQDNSTGFRQGALWVNGVQTLMTTPTGGLISGVSDVSGDGNFVVGIGNSATLQNGYRWGRDGSYIDHGRPAGTNAAWRGGSSSISDNGKTCVGFQRPFPGPATFGRGYIWFENVGTIDLNAWATMNNVNVGTVTLALPLGISGDGKTVVGQGSGGVGFVVKFTGIPVSGTVTLGDFGGVVNNRNIVVELLDPVTGNVLSTHPSKLEANGKFYFAAPAAGDYKIAVKGTHWLRKVGPVVTIGADGLGGQNFALINGDADNDNEVGGGDLSVLSGAFLAVTGDANYSDAADLDGDGEVGSSDLSILSSNFLAMGD